MDTLMYQEKAVRTVNRSLTEKQSLTNMCMGLAGESGELIDHIKKHVFHDHPMDREYVKAELGDIIWYIACLSDTLGISLDDVCRSNISKLESRYPDGFSPEMSKSR